MFPRRYRTFPGKRWINISLRTAHLLGVAGLGAGLVAGTASELWMWALYLTVTSGALMLSIEAWSSAVYLIQLRGLAMVAKVLLLLASTLVPGSQAATIVAAIVISGIVSHAPATVRYYSLFHGRTIDAL